MIIILGNNVHVRLERKRWIGKNFIRKIVNNNIMMRKTIVLIFILLITIPLSYLGMLYVSAISARYSISSVSFPQTTNLVEALLSRQLDIKVYLRIEGHGPLSVPIKSFHAQIYFEDVYVGNIKTTEPFSIPASGASTVPLTFHLDLSSISLSDIQRIIEAISSHNGEVKIGFDGYVEPIILFFPITVPIRYNVYSLTISDAPKIISMDWDSTSVAAGESVTFRITVKNVFRGASINGIFNVIVREDVAWGPDVDAKVYQFPVQLSPGESKTFSDSFITYKKASTKGFFLKTLWGDKILAEQENNYPPRLSIIEGTLSLVNAYWTVGGRTVTTCEVGEEVTAHIIVKANNAAVDGTIKVKIRKDLSLLPDRDVKIETFVVSLNKGESREYVLKFIPDEATGGSLRGYFIEIEGDLSWTMLNAYPPRLTVTSGGTPLVTRVWWTTSAGTVTQVKKGEMVQAHILIKASGGDVQGKVTIHVKKDFAYLPDEILKTQSYTISLYENQQTELIISFTASESTTSIFRGYFIQVDFDAWGFSWTMESSYPPRLRVYEEAQSEGTPSLQNVWWTVNNKIVTEVQQGQTVKAHILIKAVGGAVKGTITVRIRKDLAWLPDEDYVVRSFQLDLSEGQVTELIVTFSATQKSGLTFRGYFVQVDFDSWGTKWTMDSSYPPRLRVN